MKFPYAAKGVSKIFSAEIISLIAVILGGIAAIMAFIANSVDENTEVTLGLITLVLLFASGVLLIIGAIMNIVGYVQAAKEEEGFRRAIYCTIFSLLFSFGYYVFINHTGFYGWLGTSMNIISQVLELLAFVFTIIGLMNLSVKCNRPDMAERGATILWTLIIIYIISFIVIFITRVFRENAFNQAIVSFLSGFAVILSVVLYFFQIYYLGKAKTMLREN